MRTYFYLVCFTEEWKVQTSKLGLVFIDDSNYSCIFLIWSLKVGYYAYDKYYLRPIYSCLISGQKRASGFTRKQKIRK